ncbi:MAG: hypothetical protein U9O87_04710 [Verrucomicrobiota bacterium]|nr:hypothetical protein [Verrucomicrobiota bacterium]
MEDFTNTLWFMFSPWHIDDMGIEYNSAMSDASVLMWNYCVLKDNKLKKKIIDEFQNLLNEPLDDLLEMFVKRKEVFFRDENRIIDTYTINCEENAFGALVKFK